MNNNSAVFNILGKDLYIPRDQVQTDETWNRVIHHIDKISNFINSTDDIIYVLWMEGRKVDQFEWIIHGYHNGHMRTCQIIEQLEKGRLKHYNYYEVFNLVQKIFLMILDVLEKEKEMSIYKYLYDQDGIARYIYGVSWSLLDKIENIERYIDIDYEAPMYTSVIFNENTRTYIGFVICLDGHNMFIPVCEHLKYYLEKLPDRFLQLYFSFLRTKKKEAERILNGVQNLELKLGEDLRLLYESGL